VTPPEDGRPPIDPAVAAHDRAWLEGYTAGKRDYSPGGTYAALASPPAPRREFVDALRSSSASPDWNAAIEAALRVLDGASPIDAENAPPAPLPLDPTDELERLRIARAMLERLRIARAMWRRIVRDPVGVDDVDAIVAALPAPPECPDCGHDHEADGDQCGYPIGEDIDCDCVRRAHPPAPAPDDAAALAAALRRVDKYEQFYLGAGTVDADTFARAILAALPAHPPAPPEGFTMFADLPFPTTDAAKWAREFVRLHGGDHGLMLTWFANAIEHGRGPAVAHPPAPLPQASMTEHGYTCGHCSWGRDAVRSRGEYEAHKAETGHVGEPAPAPDDAAAQKVIRDLARDSLLRRDTWAANGWVMPVLPMEAKVRAILDTEASDPANDVIPAHGPDDAAALSELSDAASPDWTLVGQGSIAWMVREGPNGAQIGNFICQEDAEFAVAAVTFVRALLERSAS
jgi:hypothetical protein